LLFLAADHEHGVESLATDSTASATEVVTDTADEPDSLQTVSEDETLRSSEQS